MSKASALKSTSIIMILTIVSKVTGLFRDVLTASAFGTTYETDAYNMALIIPAFIFSILGSAITTTFIPMLSDIFKKSGKKAMYEFANNVMTILMAFTVISSVLGTIFAPEIVKVIAPKFTGETYTLTVLLAKISMINLLFMSLNSGFTAILQTLGDFTAPAILGIVVNVPIIIYIILGNTFGIYGLTVVTVIGNFLQVVVQLPWLFKHEYKYRVAFDLKDTEFRQLMILIVPVVIGTGVNQINSMIDKILGSGLPEGSITALGYASKLNTIAYGIFAVAVVTVVYPLLSKEGMNTDKSMFKEYISKAITNISLIIIPATIGIMILSTPLIKIIFERGAFDMESVNMTSYALLFLSISAPFMGIRDVLNRAFYSLQDTKTPMKNGILGVIVNIILNVILVRFMGIGGLALATSISAIFTTVLLYFSLRGRIGGIISKDSKSDIKKISVASIIMALLTYGFYKFIAQSVINSMILILASTVVVGAAIYGILIIILKPRVTVEIIMRIMWRFKRKK